MATGPDHYCEAERLIATAADPFDFDLTQSERNTIALAAGVHATLALAAATALRSIGRELEPWLRTAGSKRAVTP
jgi:hypothetical protein